MRKDKLEKITELLEHALTPYLDALVKAACNKDVNFEEKTLDAIIEMVCEKVLPEVEMSVRTMVRELNEKMRTRQYAAVREFIQDHPRLAEKAVNHVAKNLRCSLRRIIQEELRKLAEEKPQ
jgi:hypothetical protein